MKTAAAITPARRLVRCPLPIRTPDAQRSAIAAFERWQRQRLVVVPPAPLRVRTGHAR
jgi:hypothetical protein